MKIQVWKTTDNGVMIGFEELVKEFGEYELQAAIDFIKEQKDPPHWYQVTQEDCATVSGDELIYDREVYGDIYHDLTRY